MFYQSLITGETPYVTAVMDFEIEMPPHWHSEIEILYCMTGSYKVRVKNTEYSVSAGQAVFVGSAELHEYYGMEPGTKALLVEIGPLLLKQGFRELAEHAFSCPVVEVDRVSAELYDLFSTIIRELESGATTEAEWNIRSCLYALSAVMRRELQSENRQVARQSQRIKTMLNIYKAINYVHENYNLEIKVEDMAKLTGYQVSNFCKHFKWATQMSFHKYLNTFRINTACCLLMERSESVSSIAEKVGFSETKTFCRVFKECVKMTPTEYRDSQTGKV